MHTWNEAADPANVTPAIPAAIQRAVELIREHKPAAMTIEEADHLVEALEAPYPIVLCERSAPHLERLAPKSRRSN